MCSDPPEAMSFNCPARPSLDGNGNSFAERLRRIGAEFDWEVRQSVDAASRSAQREVRLLRGEVDWLQRQLEDERQQSAARLGLCAELQQQLEEAQQAHQQEVESREFWQCECAAFEERHGLLEAKFAALALTEAEQKAASEDAAVTDKRHKPSTRRSLNAKADQNEDEFAGDSELAVAEDIPGKVEELGLGVLGAEKADGDDSLLFEGGDIAEPLDAASIHQLMRALAEDGNSGSEKQLHQLSENGLHTLLLSAASHRQGAAALIHHIVRLWVSRLVGRGRGAALRAAIINGSMEALAALLSLGGATAVMDAVLAAASGQAADHPEAMQAVEDDEGCLLSLCVKRGEASMVSPLLEQLRGAGRTVLGSIRKARTRAVSLGCTEVSGMLTAHMVVDLSLLGNTQYCAGDFEQAIVCYTEAIDLCTEGSGGRPGCSGDLVGASEAAMAGARENLVRLRYNLGRALHRTDRWDEAREQATTVLAMDPAYVNAYALRAQASMAALDWPAAQADWDRLMAIAAIGPQGGGVGLTEDVVFAWRRRRDECQRQLNLTHYEVLELQNLASLDAVRKAYRDLARRWHPDKHQHKSRDFQERSGRRFGRIREAYEVLSEETAKRAYDAMLLLREARPLLPGHRQQSYESEPGDGEGGSGPLPSPPTRMRSTHSEDPIGSEPPMEVPTSMGRRMFSEGLGSHRWLSGNQNLGAEAGESSPSRLPTRDSPLLGSRRKVNLVNLLDPDFTSEDPDGQPPYRASRSRAT
mmetsp:Transcript_63721/g.122492  ORF Transcript_63721/g.122492 Transcript_63721/m.122492 type:complete len:756 (-) Transcript_63721:65-2332(-)